MPMFLVDTTVLADHQRGRREATSFLQHPGILLSYVTVYEMLMGAKNKKIMTDTVKIISSFEVDWGSESIGKSAMIILQNYRLKIGIGIYDCILAATALEKNLLLVTDNIKHFHSIEGLRVKKLSEVIK